MLLRPPSVLEEKALISRLVGLVRHPLYQVGLQYTPPSMSQPVIPVARRLPHLIALIVIASVSAVACVGFAAGAANIRPNPFFNDVSAINLKASLSAWADILLSVAISSAVGAIVLAGVVVVGRRVIETIYSR